MSFLGWMIDLAREQAPRVDVLRDWLLRSADAGYDAIGLYLEHRFEYASAPWAAAAGCLTPVMLRELRDTIGPRGPRVIPFLNALGHVEGFIRAEGGQWLAEGPAAGSLSRQLCPSRTECVRFSEGLIRDALAAFDDEWVHLGGDETRQLGQCPRCAERVASVGKAGLYAAHFAPLCQIVLDAGRRPCLWGDMLLAHPQALDALPRQTLIFDWQYERRPRDSTRVFRQRGFDVVCCPSLQTYNSGWCFLAESQENFDQHLADSAAEDALGVMLTTWEFSAFSQYDSVLPLVLAAARRARHGSSWEAAIEAAGGVAYANAARILGRLVPAAARFIGPETWRQLRDRLVMRQNPFALWRDWRDEAAGAAGDEVLKLCDEARRAADAASLPTPELAGLTFAIDLHRAAVSWVRQVEIAARCYADGQLKNCVSQLHAGRATLDSLRPGILAATQRGGAVADEARLDRLLTMVDEVIARIGTLRASGFRPTFETLCAREYLPGDQAAWPTGS
ncbi:MAG: family 20 glycosylhydrolase [Phycisphaerae bacterium]